MRNTADVTGDKPIAFLLQSISDVSALVAFYDIHGGKRELLFYFVPDTTRDLNVINVVHVQKRCLLASRSLCGSLSKIVDTPVNGRPSLFGIDSVDQGLLFPTIY
jgi:hypothetical protein